MILKVHSPKRATYRQYLLSRVLLSGLGVIILLVGVLNIYFAASPGGLPFWAIGLITTLGWHATFASYRVRFDLDARKIVLKAFSLYPIFNRAYDLNEVLGFRLISRGAKNLPYQIVMVCKNGEQVALSNIRYPTHAKYIAQQFADFTGLPLTVDMV